MDSLSSTDILQLTPPERLALISELWDSLEEEHLPLSMPQRDELDRRLAALEADSSRAIPWKTVKATLQSRCR